MAQVTLHLTVLHRARSNPDQEQVGEVP
ncbi:uncharacterized protein METZ01_LOCUS34654 [marine metagenome]|uniref:Uncharacterized protein n=1 Tax=marine metagenome TaxID=408172 RepID=A0A381QRQ1_9ZZZZ